MALPNHGQQWLLDERGVALVFKGIGELFGQPDPFIKLTNGEQTGIRRQGEEESSTSTGLDGKKSNDNRETDCKLIVRPSVDV